MKLRILLALSALTVSTAHANIDDYLLSQPVCNGENNTRTCVFDVFNKNHVFVETIKITNTSFLDRSMLQVHGADSSSYRVCLKETCKEYETYREAMLALNGHSDETTRKKRRVRLPNSGSPFFMNECVKVFDKVGKEAMSKHGGTVADTTQLLIDFHRRNSQTQEFLVKLGYELYVKEHYENLKNYGTLSPSQNQKDHREVHSRLSGGGHITDRQPKGSAGDTSRYAR
nr:hypothetical protein GTC16762_28950 [Pigmentibacter ruber]